MRQELTWIEVSEQALLHNFDQIQGILDQPTRLGAVVKANAYGHGLVKTAEIFASAGADFLCVISGEEAVALLEAGITKPILVMGAVSKDVLPALIKEEVRLFVPSRGYAGQVEAVAQQVGKSALVHAKIDTGMSRYGVLWEDAGAFIQVLRELSHLRIEGVATHFATADEDNSLLQTQRDRFERIQNMASIAHCANSAATLRDTIFHFNMVRVGTVLYGYYPSMLTKKAVEDINLLPALSLKTKITQCKRIPAGATVGYGASRQVQKETRIAILPIGYYDGIDRQLSNSGHVVIHGKKAPILGRICMDITTVDVSEIPSAQPGDTAVVIGESKGASITADDIAKTIDTIHYEVISRMRESIPRYYVK